MLTINNERLTLSEVIALIKDDPTLVWVKSYLHYLLKIKNSGQTTFADLAELMVKLEAYVTNEPTEGQALQRYRGQLPNGNSAMVLAPIKVTALAKVVDRVPVAALMATGNMTALVTNKSTHNTDPETGFPKGGGVSVSEFYINGAEGRRVTKRIEGQKTTYYYSDSHAYNTYKYQRLI